MPSSARQSAGIIAARVCIGLAQGLLIPAVHTVLSQVRIFNVNDRLKTLGPHGELLRGDPGFLSWRDLPLAFC